MPEILNKLRPDRDLQVYFERPSAIAAMSGASEAGVTVSGTWRQQFDWCVLEWNRDNVFEHPLFRTLPDGDLSGLTLTYEEERENCVALDSDLYPTVDWPYLRLWCTSPGGGETFHQVRLRDYAVPLDGAAVPATVAFTLTGTFAEGDVAGLAWLDETYKYDAGAAETTETMAAGVVAAINAGSATVTASRTDATIILTCVGATGANGNTWGAYGQVLGSGGAWAPVSAVFSGGESPQRWQITLPFGGLLDRDGDPVPTDRVRKLRWTYAAAMQTGAFVRSDFAVRIENWEVTGTGRAYRIAGPGSRRLEDDAKQASYYGGSWTSQIGNFSGGTIHRATVYGDSVTISYRTPQSHHLYLGTRILAGGAEIALRVDDEEPRVLSLAAAGEDVLVRIPLGEYGAGLHSVLVSHNGLSGAPFFFDFVEVAMPSETLPEAPEDPVVTLATDWDTDHSLAVPAERTAWMIRSLGFAGRVNHYVGALWFYELYRRGHTYASATVEFSGTPVPNTFCDLTLSRDGDPGAEILVRHLNLYGDTAATVAQAFALELNRGYTALWAEASGTTLTIHARAMGAEGNQILIQGAPLTGGFTLTLSGDRLAGGVDGVWTTDLDAVPAINRACRDWSIAFFAACAAYGLDATAAFSMELQHGDASLEAGIAQRYADGEPCQLNTPALQTNFSSVSREFWKRIYAEMAGCMDTAGLAPYLQFGEVQWWYFPAASPLDSGVSLPYYDAEAKADFLAAHGFPMRTIADRDVDPATFPEEAAFLSARIGAFTDAVRTHVLNLYPACRFEVLYPTDVNETPWGQVVNYPEAAWTPAQLENLKTESFTYTFTRDVNRSRGTMRYGESRGFPRWKRSFLVGPGDSSSAWKREVDLARAENLESIVLFALDQFCLIGYEVPLERRLRRGRRF